MDLQSSIEVKYKSTADYHTALEWLLEINDTKELIACDFEAAIKYTPEQIETLQMVLDADSADVFKKIAAKATLEATPLDHPSHVKVTHFNLAWSESEAIVIIMDSEEVTDLVFDFIINTDIKQVWHRAAYDFCLIYYNTGQFPKNFEDSQVFAKTVFNHVDVFKARTGLKELAGSAYGRWGMVTESDDFFVLANMYDPQMIEYAATDACATMFVWNRLVENFHEEGVVYPDTTEHYSPWDQLPAPNPKDTEYSEAHFYHHTGKWLVKDTVRIMMNGLPTDLVRVKELEAELEQILDKVKTDISQNETAKLFINMMSDHQIEQYKKSQKGKMRSASYYLKPFSTKNAVHRCFFMDVFAEKVGLSKPAEKLGQGCSKWSVKTIKAFTDKFAPLSALVNHTLSPDNPTAVLAMKRLAEVQAENYNKKYKEQIENPDIPEFEFNPNSDAHKLAFFEWAGITSDKFSKKTGLASWDRDQIEQVNKTTSDPDIKAFTQSLIDHSFAAIVRNNFVKAFYRYSVEGRLYGKYSLFGAKSGRFTSSQPNMLNAPSSKSAFSKPIKKCFTAPAGFIVAGIDYAALEDRVIANLSLDQNKLDIFLKGVDGHSQAAVTYWPERAAEIIGEHIEDITERAIRLKQLVDEGNKEAITLRSNSKGISFGLAYGAYPPKVAASAKLPLSEAEDIFVSYHNKLFPGITEYRNEHVLTKSKEQGYLHLGLGFRIYTDSPDADIRTVANATCQFWSVLSILAINKLHQLIDEAGYQEDIIVTSTIYDSIYFIVRDDLEIIKWLNDRIVPIMEQDFMEEQTLSNSADLEIGPNWAELYHLDHNISTQEIEEVRKKWH